MNKNRVISGTKGKRTTPFPSLKKGGAKESPPCLRGDLGGRKDPSVQMKKIKKLLTTVDQGQMYKGTKD